MSSKDSPTEKKNTKSPSLEVISREDRIKFDERRHLPRLCLTAEQFRLSKTGKIFSVTDLSQNGMGIWIMDREDLKFFTVGLLVEGTINLRREKYPVQVRVRNLNIDRVGFEFEDLKPEVAGSIRDFLDPKVLGAELKPIPSPELSTLWYHGPSGTDLLLHRSTDGQYTKLTLYVLGSFIQWEPTAELSTGRTILSTDASELRGIMRLETLLLEKDSKPDPGKLGIAKTVILSSNLPQDLKGWCVRQLDRE